MRFEPISPFGVVASDYTLAELADPSVQARLVDAWHDAGGLLVLRGTLLSPSELVEAGKIFGRVENMVETKMRPEAIMETHPEIFLVHNVDFSRAVLRPGTTCCATLNARAGIPIRATASRHPMPRSSTA